MTSLPPLSAASPRSAVSHSHSHTPTGFRFEPILKAYQTNNKAMSPSPSKSKYGARSSSNSRPSPLQNQSSSLSSPRRRRVVIDPMPVQPPPPQNYSYTQTAASPSHSNSQAALMPAKPAVLVSSDGESVVLPIIPPIQSYLYSDTDLSSLFNYLVSPTCCLFIGSHRLEISDDHLTALLSSGRSLVHTVELLRLLDQPNHSAFPPPILPTSQFTCVPPLIAAVNEIRLLFLQRRDYIRDLLLQFSPPLLESPAPLANQEIDSLLVNAAHYHTLPSILQSLHSEGKRFPSFDQLKSAVSAVHAQYCERGNRPNSPQRSQASGNAFQLVAPAAPEEPDPHSVARSILFDYLRSSACFLFPVGAEIRTTVAELSQLLSLGGSCSLESVQAQVEPRVEDVNRKPEFVQRLNRAKRRLRRELDRQLRSEFSSPDGSPGFSLLTVLARPVDIARRTIRLLRAMNSDYRSLFPSVSDLIPAFQSFVSRALNDRMAVYAFLARPEQKLIRIDKEKQPNTEIAFLDSPICEADVDAMFGDWSDIGEGDEESENGQTEEKNEKTEKARSGSASSRARSPIVRPSASNPFNTRTLAIVRDLDRDGKQFESADLLIQAVLDARWDRVWQSREKRGAKRPSKIQHSTASIFAFPHSASSEISRTASPSQSPVRSGSRSGSRSPSLNSSPQSQSRTAPPPRTRTIPSLSRTQSLLDPRAPRPLPDPISSPAADSGRSIFQPEPLNIEKSPSPPPEEKQKDRNAASEKDSSLLRIPQESFPRGNFLRGGSVPIRIPSAFQFPVNSNPYVNPLVAGYNNAQKPPKPDPYTVEYLYHPNLHSSSFDEAQVQYRSELLDFLGRIRIFREDTVQVTPELLDAVLSALSPTANSKAIKLFHYLQRRAKSSYAEKVKKLQTLQAAERIKQAQAEAAMELARKRALGKKASPSPRSPANPRSVASSPKMPWNAPVSPRSAASAAQMTPTSIKNPIPSYDPSIFQQTIDPDPILYIDPLYPHAGLFAIFLHFFACQRLFYSFEDLIEALATNVWGVVTETQMRVSQARAEKSKLSSGSSGLGEANEKERSPNNSNQVSYNGPGNPLWFEEEETDQEILALSQEVPQPQVTLRWPEDL